jgi:dTDP-glucose 4,6-dehydratase
MKVLVTGGAGFIGSNFVRMAIGGHFPEIERVTVLDNLSYAGNLENLKSVENQIEFVEGDILDSSLVKKILSEVDSVINFAAESHVDRSIINPKIFVETNILGVQNFLDLMRLFPEKRFLQVSTDEVYGSIASETSPLQPNSPYSATKASADLLVQSYYKTFHSNVVITRCSNNYGPFQFPEKIIPSFVTRLIQKQKVGIYGDGSHKRDWLHVDDHCRGIYAAAVRGNSGEIYNLGGGTELSNNELTERILKLTGASDSLVEFVKDRPGHDIRYSVNWSKSERCLGYSPQVEFDLGLSETVDWYKTNPKWWGKA